MKFGKLSKLHKFYSFVICHTSLCGFISALKIKLCVHCQLQICYFLWFIPFKKLSWVGGGGSMGHFKGLSYANIIFFFTFQPHEYHHHHHHHTHQSNNQYSYHQWSHQHNRYMLSILKKVSWVLEGIDSFLGGPIGVDLIFKSICEHYKCSGRIMAAH